MKRLVILVSLLSFCLVGCNHYYYLPNVHNVPMFVEKNEYRLSGFCGSETESNSIELQSAYSVTNHTALMFNFMKAKGVDSENTSSWGKGDYYEGALGYYKSLGTFSSYNKPFGLSKSVALVATFEVYGGYAKNNQHHEYDKYGSISDLSYTKIFIQPSISVTSDLADYALSARISRVSFDKIDYYLSKYSSSSHSKELIDLINTKVSYLFEPAVTMRFGWKYVKLQLQIGGTSNLTNKNLKFDNINASVGICFSLAKRYKTAPLKELSN